MFRHESSEENYDPTISVHSDAREHVNTRLRIPDDAGRVVALVSHEQNSIGTVTAQAGVLEPRRLTIPDAGAQSARHAPEHAHNVVHLLRLPCCTDRDRHVALSASV